MADYNEGIPASPGLSLVEPPPTDLPPGSPRGARFLIVGIGASAGGLEALTEFFSQMPPESGMAFVVITHQAADRISLLPELLGKHTAMPVDEVTAGITVEPNRVYLSPPGQYLALLSSILQPMPGDTPSGSVQFPIDYFFRSLADDQKDKAIGIVLSGTGTDGTLGVRAVKDAGGLILAQEETSAKFAGMPNSARATGMVDYVLPAAQMPHTLSTLAQSPYVQGAVAPVPQRGLTPDLLRQISIVLRTHTKHDFSVYKPSTLYRRIERRMHIHQIHAAEHYVRFLREHPHECDLLFQEVLIGVTRFFRDPEAFAFLATTALPELFTARPEAHPLRVWVPGCSTGEEAYTIAILLREYLERVQSPGPVQIFATDLNTQAIERARTGRYPHGIVMDVSPERLERYFLTEDSHYCVKKDLRDMVVFAPHNLLTDPPFTKLDLISCRNVLIYVEAEAQHHLLSLFSYALTPGGLLFLGSSETNGGFPDLFTTLDYRWKVFRRKDSGPVGLPSLARGTGRTALRERKDPAEHGFISSSSDLPLARMVEQLLVHHFALPSVLITDRGDIVYIHGLTGLFLQPAPGPPSHNLFAMAREELRSDLTVAVRQVTAQKSAVVQKQMEVRTNGTVSRVEVTIQKVDDPEPLRGLLLVSFGVVPDSPARPRTPKRGRLPLSDQPRVEELEHEIQRLRETLQRTLEGSSTATEELTSTNEELQSTNEELQSANEELETTKEETQSLNEELQTVNAELQSKLEDLSQAQDDLQNLLNSTELATLFLDMALRIKRFTPRAQQLFKLIATDVGRPLADLVSTLRYEQLQADAQEVLRTLIFKELELSSHEGRWYMMRMLPYRTSENLIAGLVLTFSDITQQKQAEQRSEEARRYAEAIVATVREPLVILDAALQVLSANPSFYRTFQLSPPEVTRQHLYALSQGQWKIPRLRELLEDIMAQHSTFEDFAVDFLVPGSGHKRMLLNARRIERAPELPPLILLAMEETTRHP